MSSFDVIIWITLSVLQGPYDDIIIFAHSAKYHGIKMYILNEAFYGWLPQPLEPPHKLQDEVDQFTHIRTEHVGEVLKVKY